MCNGFLSHGLLLLCNSLDSPYNGSGITVDVSLIHSSFLWIFDQGKSLSVSFGCIGFAFTGTVLIISPSFEAIETNALYALASGMLSALAYLSIRKLRTTASSESVVFWFAIFCVLVSFPLSAKELVALSSYEIQILVSVGITAGVGQIGMTRAFHAAKAAYIGAFSYSTVVVSWIYGTLIFDEILSFWDMIGTLLILGSGIVLATTSSKESPTQVH